MKKRIIPVILILILIAGFIYYFLTHNQKEAEPIIRVSGNIETTEANVGFKIAGRIVSRSFEEGDWVKKGSVLATLDDKDLRRRLELDRAAIASADARLRKLLAGSRTEEIKRAGSAARCASRRW